MSYELIICEKPKAAEKIANALADSKPIKKSENGVPHYLIAHNKRDIVVGCAVGHLFGLKQKEDKNWDYPQFDIEWRPTYEVSKTSAFSKKYLQSLKKLTKGADSFTIATDYDVEGEVIGLNVLRYACKQQDGRRMKFSTLTKGDLVKAYESAEEHIDWGLAKAGETRHKLDWYYGINLSRALTTSMKKAGVFKVLSSGRVQGPALKIIVDREREIKSFVPKPFWEIHIEAQAKNGVLNALHKEEKFWEKNEADSAMANIKGKDAIVDDVTRKKFNQTPPTPFDLTTLQTESYKCLGFAPKDTLAMAQNLYIEGVISYPRTSSQKLPKEIGIKKIIETLKKQDDYVKACDFLLALKELKPNEGKKSDPAHPAIYPTGQIPKTSNTRELKLYDLIVRRFLAVFGKPAVRETNTIKLDINGEIFVTKGTRTIEKNWHELYGKYASYKEEELPEVEKGEEVKVTKREMLDKETQPPKRYTPASIIKELEKRNLGTKATRAAIVEALYNRDYTLEKSIEATDLGIHVVSTLEKYSPRILSEELTRKFEDYMEKIQDGEKEPEDVLEEARTILYDILMDFKKHETEVGGDLIQAYRDTRNQESHIGKCLKCDNGDLRLIYSKKTKKRFIVCTAYPDCKNIFQVPQKGKIKGLGKQCQHCEHPLIQVKTGKRPQQLCINPECPGKEQKDDSKANAIDAFNKKEQKCPKCDKPLLVRKSIYGQFIGCSGYPKCKYTARLEEYIGKDDKKESKE